MTLLLRSVRSRSQFCRVLNQVEQPRPSRHVEVKKISVFRYPNYSYLVISSSTSFSTSSYLSWRDQSRLSRKPLDEKYEDDGENQSASPERIITVPLHLKQRLEKKIIRQGKAGYKQEKIVEASREGKKSVVLLHCKRPEFNHYLGQSYPKNVDAIPLASKGWGHKKSAGDWFTIKPTKSTDSSFKIHGSSHSFEELGVRPNIVQTLKDNNAIKPTIVQELAIPEILKGTNNLVAAETGCGKTLAYLVPIVQQILMEKRLRKKRGVNQPLVVILVPSHELAQQIHYVATKLTEGMDIAISVLKGGNLSSKITNPTAVQVDLLISTVHVASVLTTAGVYSVKNVDHVVLDEADTLLDDSFSEDVLDFLRKFPLFPGLPRIVQLTMVSATLPQSVETILADVVPMDTLNRITTPGLHFVLSHVPQTFIRLRKSQKPDKLLEIVQSDVKNNIPLMIFCNNTKTCDWMDMFLTHHNIKCVRVHGETPPTIRKGLLDLYQNGEVDVLLCTDLGSRGIDTIRTKHVVNYEFPMFLADYIHRCGRTGRIGSAKGGHVTNLVSRRFEFETVQEIERSVRKEMSLVKVNANIKRLLTSKHGMFQPIAPVNEEV